VTSPFTHSVVSDCEGLLRCIRREGTPERVHNIELYLDLEVQDALCERYGIGDRLDRNDPFFLERRQVALQSFLGYDYVRCGLEGINMPLRYGIATDTADLIRETGRHYVDEHRGPITNWQEFEAYPWPDAEAASTRALEWYEENLPENMCVIGTGGFAHFAEYLSWLMGYETLCLALYDDRDLVKAISERLVEMYRVVLIRLLQFEKVRIIWGSDDMGFRSSTLIKPNDLREFVLPGHKMLADMSHAAGRPYLLHCCGKIDLIMEDLIAGVGIDAKHSFEDTIESVVEAKAKYGDRIALLGGIDIDFLCRSDEAAIRKRVRETLEVCHPGGGYCLGTGNSMANYIPLDHYLAMLDEGRRFA
jgi:uroporphyrinogen decarboxylase